MMRSVRQGYHRAGRYHARMTRRESMRLAGAAGAALTGVDVRALAPRGPLDRFGDLPRHFVFEYYPWFAVDPYRHWDEGGRVPPIDLGSNYVPKLGAYDSRSVAVIEQHARWILESGAGAIDVSWWGRDSFENALVPVLMDVMSAHGIQVAFHLEPYSRGRAARYADDVEYLIRRYGDRRGWDCMLCWRTRAARSAR